MSCESYGFNTLSKPISSPCDPFRVRLSNAFTGMKDDEVPVKVFSARVIRSAMPAYLPGLKFRVSLTDLHGNVSPVFAYEVYSNAARAGARRQLRATLKATRQINDS